MTTQTTKQQQITALKKELGSEQLMVVGGAESDVDEFMYELYGAASRLIYYGLRAKGLDRRRAQKVVAGLGAFADGCELGETDDYVVLASRVLADIRALGVPVLPRGEEE